MGVFSEYQPRYAEHGIATFPVDGERKKPLVKQPDRFGLRGSSKLVERFPDAQALGFWAGPNSRITVIDIDRNEESFLADCLNRFGQTPLIARSASRKGFHCYYRHSGEPRRIRFEGEAIDILGAGVVIAPPSVNTKGLYEFVSGGFDDIKKLPRLRNVGQSLKNEAVREDSDQQVESIKVGVRNDSLWKMCMVWFAQGLTREEVQMKALETNRQLLEPPLSELDVKAIVGSASKYTEQGENWYDGVRRVSLPHEVVDSLLLVNPDALVLLTKLKREHWARDFVVANAMASRMGWTLRKFRDARCCLLDSGYIREVRRPRKNQPAAYTFGGACAFRGRGGEKELSVSYW